MKKELSKVYDPHEVEERIYQQWEENKCFAGVRDAKKKSYTIVMPPPNVTGQLHMGHAMDCTLAGYPDPLQADAGLCRPVAPRHGPRRHRHPDQSGGGAARERGPDPL